MAASTVDGVARARRRKPGEPSATDALEAPALHRASSPTGLPARIASTALGERPPLDPEFLLDLHAVAAQQDQTFTTGLVPTAAGETVPWTPRARVSMIVVDD